MKESVLAIYAARARDAARQLCEQPGAVAFLERKNKMIANTFVLAMVFVHPVHFRSLLAHPQCDREKARKHLILI